MWCFFVFTVGLARGLGISSVADMHCANGSLTGEAVTTSPTIGSNVEEISYKSLRFIMWDIGGQESLRVCLA